MLGRVNLSFRIVRLGSSKSLHAGNPQALDIQNPNTEEDINALLSYETLINKYVAENNINQVEKTFTKMQTTFKSEIPIHLYSSILDFYFDHQIPHKAERFHKEMKEKEIKLNLSTYIILIEGYFKNSKYKKAKKIFSELQKEENIPLNTNICNLMIDGLTKNEKYSAAEKIYDYMKIKNIQPNFFTFSSIINGLLKNKKFEEAKLLFPNLINELKIKENWTDSNMQEFMGIKNKMKEKYKTNVRFSLIDYIFLIKGFLTFKKNHFVIQLFDDIVLYKLIPNFYDLLHNLITKKQYKEALFVFYQMRKHKFNIDLKTYLIMVNGLITNNDFINAKKLFYGMKKIKLKPDFSTCSNMINCFLTNKSFKNLSQFINYLQTNYNFHLNILMFNQIISSCVINNQFELAQYFYNTLKESNLKPSAESYTFMIYCYVKNSNISSALDILKEMKANDIYLNEIIEKVIIDEIEDNLDTCLKFLDEAILYCSSAESVYNSVLSRLISADKINLAFKIYISMLNNSVSKPDQETFSIMISGFSNCSLTDSRLIKEFCSTIDDSITTTFSSELKDKFHFLQVK